MKVVELEMFRQPDKYIHRIFWNAMAHSTPRRKASFLSGRKKEGLGEEGYNFKDMFPERGPNS